MDWTRGFSASYYGYYIDPASWRNIERFEIVSGSIEKNDEELRQSASLTLTDYEQGVEKWVRIYLDTKQDENGAHIPLFTGLAVTPDKDIIGFHQTYSLDCYSVLKPAQDILLERGWYAPAESQSGLIINELLSGFAPVNVADNSPLLSQAIIAEDGETNLSMVNKILLAINWYIRIDGDGTINVLPKPIEVSAKLDPYTNDIIEPEITYTRDLFDCPNCFRAIANDMTAIAKDESLTSPLSIPNRGREVWKEETGCSLADNESITEYALRRLKEEQTISATVSYKRRFDPSINVGDKIILRYQAQGIDGIYTVTSQSIELGFGARVTEEVKNE